MKFVSDAELQRLLDPDQVIAALRAAFTRGMDGVHMPVRTQIPSPDGTLLLMPCSLAGDPICGIKIVSVSRQARPAGRVAATYILFDSASGQTLAVLDANHLTDMRTAAISAIATDLLARPDASVLGIFGTGRQAEAHLSILPRVRRFEKAYVAGTSPAKTHEFAAKMRDRCALPVEAVDAATLVSACDVICTCTTSTEPLFSGQAIRAGTHLNLIGAFQPHAREVDSVALQRARVFVDSVPAALEEAGDILVPLRAGEIPREHIRGDLHQLLTGAVRGREQREDITMFKSVGLALEDLMVAKLVYLHLSRL